MGGRSTLRWVAGHESNAERAKEKHVGTDSCPTRKLDTGGVRVIVATFRSQRTIWSWRNVKSILCVLSIFMRPQSRRKSQKRPPRQPRRKGICFPHFGLTNWNILAQLVIFFTFPGLQTMNLRIYSPCARSLVSLSFWMVAGHSDTVHCARELPRLGVFRVKSREIHNSCTFGDFHEATKSRREPEEASKATKAPMRFWLQFFRRTKIYLGSSPGILSFSTTCSLGVLAAFGKRTNLWTGCCLLSELDSTCVTGCVWCCSCVLCNFQQPGHYPKSNETSDVFTRPPSQEKSRKRPPRQPRRQAIFRMASQRVLAENSRRICTGSLA